VEAMAAVWKKTRREIGETGRMFGHEVYPEEQRDVKGIRISCLTPVSQHSPVWRQPTVFPAHKYRNPYYALVFHTPINRFRRGLYKIASLFSIA
jgi:hypothetical protein